MDGIVHIQKNIEGVDPFERFVRKHSDAEALES